MTSAGYKQSLKTRGMTVLNKSYSYIVPKRLYWIKKALNSNVLSK